MSTAHPLAAIATLREMAADRGGRVLAVSGDGAGDDFYAGLHREPARTLLEALLTFVAGDYDEILLFAGRGEHLPSAPVGPLVRLGASRAAIYLRRQVADEARAVPAQPAARFTVDFKARRQRREAAGLHRVAFDATNMDWKTRVSAMLDRIESSCGIDHIGNPLASNGASAGRRRLMLIDADFLIPDRARWREECVVSQAEAGHIPQRFARIPQECAGTSNDVVLLARDPAEMGALTSGEIVRRRLDEAASKHDHLKLGWRQVACARIPGRMAADAFRAYYPQPTPLAYEHFRTVPLSNPKSWRPQPIGVLSPEQLFERLNRQVIGQDAALRKIAESVTTNVATRAQSDQRPIGVFLLAGPTGSGKTETAKALAKALFGDTRRYFSEIRMDQLAGDFALFGVPPGYTGYTDDMRMNGGGRLTAPLVRYPDHPRVILLDEIEKGPEEYAEKLFGVLDEGRATDASSGHEVSFRDTIVVVTTNVGAEQLSTLASSGVAPAEIEKRTRTLLLEYGPSTWSPAFLARFRSGVLAFTHPRGEALGLIVRKAIKECVEADGIYHLGSVSPAFVSAAVTNYTPTFGIRDLIERVEDPLKKQLAEIRRKEPGGLMLSISDEGQLHPDGAEPPS